MIERSLVQVHDCCDSTNRLAREWARQGAPHGACVLAYEQTAGRGRRGRSFYSPAGRGLYMSFVLRTKEPVTEGQLITVEAALRAAEALDPFARPVFAQETKIKWVNDIYLAGRKIAGILAELADDRTVVLGIGVNVFGEAADFPEELRDRAGSLLGPAPKDAAKSVAPPSDSALQSAKPPQSAQAGDGGARGQLERVAEALIDAFRRPSLPAEEILAQYRRRSYLPGRAVQFEENGILYRAVARDIADNGNLIVLLPDGTEKTLSSGEVSVKEGTV